MNKDTYLDAGGRELWSEGNSKGKRAHSLAKLPVALTPFDPESAKAAIDFRWNKVASDTEQAMIRYASAQLGREATLQEATDLVINDPQFRKSQEGHTAASLFLARRLGQVPLAESQSQTTIQDNRQINVYFANPDKLRDYIGILTERSFSQDKPRLLAQANRAQEILDNLEPDHEGIIAVPIIK